MRIEAIFGGILALFVLGVAIYYGVLNRGGGGYPPDGPVVVGPGVDIADGDTICQCYDEAFRLAGSNVGVMSSQYRTGFEQCRAILGVEGGDAWTAGWNARLSAKPYEASCRNYRRRA